MQSLKIEELAKIISKYKPFTELKSGIIAKAFRAECSDIAHPLAALLIACLVKESHNNNRFFVIVPNSTLAENFAADCQALGLDAVLMPWWQTAAYRPVENKETIRKSVFGKRATAIASMLDSNGPRIIVASQRAAMTPVPSPSDFSKTLLKIKTGQTVDPVVLSEKLVSLGYARVQSVSVPGEFALRGEVLDVFMPGDDNAIRLAFNYDIIHEIRRFDPVLQTSLNDKPSYVVLRPLKEYILTDDLVKKIESELLACPLPKNVSDISRRENLVSELVEQLLHQGECLGEELLYPLLYDKPHSIFEYAAPDDIAVFLDMEHLSGQAEAIKREYSGLYRKAVLEGPIPPPDRILVDFAEIAETFSRSIVTWSLKNDEATNRISFGAESPRFFLGNINYLRDEINSLHNAKYQVHIFAENSIQSERIASLINNENVKIYVDGLSAGFILSSLKIVCIHENEIFGRRKRVLKSLKSTRSKVIDSFIELNPGDFIVHVNYGIGKFIAIERVHVLGNDRDYIKIEYLGDEHVFVPIEQANLVQRYIGNEGDAPKLDSLGSKSWEKRKSRVQKSLEDLAERLIRIYSRRSLSKGFAFPPDGEWQTAFEASFQYEETEDQITCIEEVKKDMESTRPMDRLICGDVGYGKTEIALRAAFKAVMGGKQVAFLAPTTILAEQHFNTCKERFSDLPIRIGLVSRLVEKKDQKKTLEQVLEGSIDILIGTHRLLQKDVAFKDLGLLIVDEEQRFGVKDKERLKEMRANIDCLTLTATPIPRTLHMSMLKVRDLSVLTTPPDNRRPIQTLVDEFSPDIVAKAIRKEVERDGQVFFLHNRIQSLDDTVARIQSLVPEVVIESAHGQMEPQDLEDVMRRFIHKGFHVLVSTSIIENGIDIPNVNTIIIDRADMYGISQLYQLRGRVGRSDRLAYAYLLYPDGRSLSELAMKRLQIISDHTSLGSGFKIAMKDLEIRGAGNLLGREQSGDIYAVGFDLYLKLLDEAVARLSDEGYDPEGDPYLELEYTGYIPNDYISQQSIKIEVYKKIASIVRQDELDALHTELEDRFGPLPEGLFSLLALAEIRIICKRLFISSLVERRGFVTVEFSKLHKVSVDKVLRLIRESGQKIKLDSKRPNVLIISVGPISLKEKSEFIRDKLMMLSE